MPPFAESHGRIVIAHSPLAQGLLSGSDSVARNRPTNPARATASLFSPENLERAGKLISVLREVAQAHSAAPGADRAGLGNSPSCGDRNPGCIQRGAA